MAHVRHRGGSNTEDSYKGIPIDAARGVHAMVADLLVGRLPPGARVADLGAGRGALSRRLHDAGFDVVSFDADPSEWQASDISCHTANLDSEMSTVEGLGPYDALCAVELIEHLENPRDFLRQLVRIAQARRSWLIISTPNPLDTFSCISMFTRGTFGWFSPDAYGGGGHISILPYWLLSEHLKYLGADEQEYYFAAPWSHPTPWKQSLYKAMVASRRLVLRSRVKGFVEGQTAIVAARP